MKNLSALLLCTVILFIVITISHAKKHKKYSKRANLLKHGAGYLNTMDQSERAKQYGAVLLQAHTLVESKGFHAAMKNPRKKMRKIPVQSLLKAHLKGNIEQHLKEAAIRNGAGSEEANIHSKKLVRALAAEFNTANFDATENRFVRKAGLTSLIQSAGGIEGVTNIAKNLVASGGTGAEGSKPSEQAEQSANSEGEGAQPNEENGAKTKGSSGGKTELMGVASKLMGGLTNGSSKINLDKIEKNAAPLIQIASGLIPSSEKEKMKGYKNMADMASKVASLSGDKNAKKLAAQYENLKSKTGLGEDQQTEQDGKEQSEGDQEANQETEHQEAAQESQQQKGSNEKSEKGSSSAQVHDGSEDHASHKHSRKHGSSSSDRSTVRHSTKHGSKRHRSTEQKSSSHGTRHGSKRYRSTEHRSSSHRPTKHKRYRSQTHTYTSASSASSSSKERQIRKFKQKHAEKMLDSAQKIQNDDEHVHAHHETHERRGNQKAASTTGTQITTISTLLMAMSTEIDTKKQNTKKKSMVSAWTM
uniref:Uncharacterized protein n=1 Tax=Ditylenchus dipsaci TaxID=166011 RepID=A0A915EF66_9BILA